MTSGPINFIGATSINNGITEKIGNLEHIHPRNTITVSYNGSVGEAFYQDRPYWASDDINVFYPKFKMSESTGLYVLAPIIKSGKKYGYAFKWKISLPTTIDGNADFTYMEDYVNDIQKQQYTRIKDYLKVKKLDDYTLSSKEENALNRFNQNEIVFQKFKITDEFKIKNSLNNLKSDVVFNSGITPYVTASEGNNSVVSRIACPENMKEEGNAIMIGGKTLVVTYQPEDFVSNDSHNLILYMNNSALRNENIQLFCVCTLNHFLKPIYSWGDSISKAKIQKDIFSLPVTPNGDIDYDFMENFISAQKKLIAKKLICWLEQQNINDNILKIEKNIPDYTLPEAADKNIYREYIKRKH